MVFLGIKKDIWRDYPLVGMAMREGLPLQHSQ